MLAGVSYTWGREGESEYNETFAGRLKEPSSIGDHQFYVKVDPFYNNGRYCATTKAYSVSYSPILYESVLPLVYGGDPGIVGQADKKVQVLILLIWNKINGNFQAYNVRLCLTNNASNMIPLPTPPNYNPDNWELFRRYIIALNETNLSMGM